MKSFIVTLLICSVFLFTNCDNTSTSTAPRATTLEDVSDAEPYTVDESTTLPPTVTLNAPEEEKSTMSESVEARIDAEIKRQLKLNPELPALNEVAASYNNITVKVFTGLADATGGETYMVDNAKFVVEAITDIIKTYMSNETDLVFLIDKTGSMSDDIAEIKKSITAIIEQIAPFENTRVGFAFYGDINIDKATWYSKVNLSDDFTAAKKIIASTYTTGGGNLEESVYDGVAKTIKEMNWEEGRRRVILLIGDAPSLEPPYSEFTMDDVIKMAKDESVSMNFYPIVIGLSGSINGVGKLAEVPTTDAAIIASIAPNPATNYTLLKATATGKYTVEIFDINGKLIQTKKFNDNNTSIMTDELATGVYVIRLYDEDNKKIDSKKLVVRH